MSDNRVEETMLKFTFNNEQFESGVRKSISTLLNFKHTVTDTLNTINGKAVDGLSKAFKGFNASGVAEDVDTISKRFSTMGIIGTTALQTLTQKAVNLGVSLVQKVLSPINSIFGIVKNKGWSRAAGVKQAQFMIDNLGLSWKDAEGIINDAVDGTRFGFDEAATAAAQLATSGVKFGPQMEQVLKAIGNTASMANVEFSDMSHIFTTMASNGRVYGEQLQQMSYRGLNATKALADYLNTTESHVKEMVTDGKVSFTDFYKAMNEMFGDAAHKADETFTGALANNKAVFARIGQVYASGFMDAALVVLQHTKPMLKKFEKAIKPFGELAGDAMSAVAHYLVPIIDSINFDKITNFVDKYVTPLREKIQAITDEIKGVKDEVQKTLLPAEELLEMANKVIRGDYGNGQKRRDELEALGYSYEQIQNKVNELLGCSFRYEVAEEDATDATGESTDAINEQARALIDLNKKFSVVENLLRFVNGMKKIVDLGKYMGQTIVDVFQNRVLGLLPKAIGLTAAALGEFGEKLGQLIDWVINFDVYGKTINGFLDMFSLGVDIIKWFTRPFREFVKEVLASESVANIFDDIKRGVEAFINAFASFGSKTKNFFTEFYQLSGISRLLTHFGNLVTWVKDRMVGMVTGFLDFVHKVLNAKVNEKKGFLKLFGEDGVINFMANRMADVIDFFLAFGKRVKELLKLMSDGKTAFLDRITDFITKHMPKLSASLSEFKSKFSGTFDFSSLQGGGNAIRNFFGKIGEYLEKIKNLDGVQKMITMFKTLGELLKETFLTNLEKALKFIDETFGTKLKGSDDFINIFGEGGVVDTAANIVANFVDNLTKAPEKFDEFFRKIQNLPKMISEKSSIGKSVVETFSKIFEEASKGLPNFFKFLTNGMTQFVGEATASVVKGGLTKTPIGSALDGVVDKVMAFVGWLLKADKAVETAKSSLATASESAEGLQELMDHWKEIEPTIMPVFEGITDHLKKLKDWDGNDLVNFLKGMAIVKILRQSAKAIGKFGGIFESISEVIGGKEGSIKAIFSSFAGIGTSISNTASSFQELAKNWSNVSGVFKQWRKKPFTTALRDFAIAVALIAGSIALLGSDLINYDKIRDNSDILITFAGALMALAGILAVAPPEKINAMALAFAGMGIGMLALAGAVALFGLMDPEVLIQGGAAVVTFMLFMGTAAAIGGALGKASAAAFLAMAIAVNLLVPAVYLFGKMDWDVLVQGGKAIAAFMVIMALATRLAGSVSGMTAVSFLAIALAINLLMPAVFLLGKMDRDTLIQGGTAIAVFMGIMALAVRLAGNASMGAAVSFLAIAVAIDLLVPALALLSMLKVNKLMGAVTAISLAMLAIGVAINIASKNKGSFKAAIAMAAATYLIGIALVELAAFPMTKVLASAVSLAVVFLSLTYAFKVMQKMDGKKLYASVGALLLVVGGVAFVIGALAKFTNVGEVIGIAISIGGLVLALTLALKLLKGIEPKDALKAGAAIDIIAGLIGALIGVAAYFTYNIDDLAQRLNKFGLAINAFFEGLQGNDINERAEKTEEAGKSMQTFAQSIGEFLEMLDDVDESKAANAKALAEAIWALTKTEIVQAIASFLGLNPDFGTFGNAMVQYAQAFFAFVDAVEGHGDVNTDNMASVLECTDDWIDLANKLGPNVGLFATIAGFTDMGKFGEQMKTFGESFLTFSNTVNQMGTIDIDKINDIADGTEPMIRIAEKLEANSGWLPTFFGITDIGKFGTQLKDFSDGFKEFYSNLRRIGNVTPERVQMLADATTPMVELGKTLWNSGGVLQWFAGAPDLSSFGTSLAGLATGVKDFCAAINTPEVDTERLQNVTTALANLAGLGDTSSTFAVDSFATALTNLGVAIGTYAVNAKDFSAADLLFAINALEQLRDFFVSVSGEEMGGVSEFIKAFTEVGKTSTEKFAESFTSTTDTVSMAIATYFETLANSVTTDAAEHFNTSGHDVAKAFSDGFTGYSSTASTEISTNFVSVILSMLTEQNKHFVTKGMLAAIGYASGISTGAGAARTAAERLVSWAVGGLGGAYSKFYDQGVNAAQGFRDGIEAEGWKAVNAARDMANQALDELARAQNSNSPSKEFAKLGRYAAQGYAQGIEQDATLSGSAAEEMAKESLAKAMLIVSSIASMVDQNMESSPVIRPVIDTSGVEYGIGQIDSLFNRTEGVATNMMYRASDIQNRQQAIAFDRASTDYTEKFNNLIDSNGKLIDAVRENRYAIIDGDDAFNYINRRMGSA